MIKQELINKYNLTESQYKYELTRSQKSNIHISKWLKKKYEFYHYTSGSKLNEIFNSEKLIGCNISNQENMVWFSNDDYTPASTFNFKINNTNLKDWWKEILPILEHNQKVFLKFGQNKSKRVKFMEKLND